MKLQKYIKKVLDRSVVSMEWSLADIEEEIHICNQLCSALLKVKKRKGKNGVVKKTGKR